jgi:hypothetical protein
VAVKPHHQATLIVLLARLKFDMRHQREIARLSYQQAMPIISLKTVVGGLPEIRFFIGEDFQTIPQAILPGFVEPEKILGQRGLQKMFATSHNLAPK